MRIANAVRFALIAVAAAMLCVSLVACAAQPSASKSARGADADADLLAAFLAAQGDTENADEDMIARMAEAHAKRLAGEAPAPQQAPAPRGIAANVDASGYVKPTRPQAVEWIDVSHPSEGRREGRAAAKPAPVPVVQLPEPVVQTVAVSPVDSSRADPSQLAIALAEAIRQSDDAGPVKALRLAALGAVDTSVSLSDGDIRKLDYEHRAFYRSLSGLLGELSTHAATSDTPLDSDRLREMLDGMAGSNQPLTVRDIKLCRSVSGYGVYEPFKEARFLAGREQPAIVYLELDHFTSQKKGEQYEVRLTQEVVLYNAADGLEVWKHPQEEIVDKSRNRRRDFFVVQLVRLPARLTVGKYQLKVRVTDRHGDSMDAVTMPIEVVADASMVRGQRGR